MTGNEARKIIEKAEKALLNVRIGEVVRKNHLLDLKKSQVVRTLSETLPEGLHKKIVKINEERQKKELEKARETQVRKYQSLLEARLRTQTKIEAPHK